MKSQIATFLLCALIAICSNSVARAQVLRLEPGDHVCLVGNALGERMQHHNHFEKMLHERFAHQKIVVRNLCFPGDEVDNRLRSLNFGSPDDHLTHSKATVVLFCFGYGESFAGEDGLDAFSQKLEELVKQTKTKNYSGKGPPRVALISPIAFEHTADPNLPDGKEHNARLSLYVEAMRAVADKSNVGFVDLFAPTKWLAEPHKQRQTLNGFT